MSTPVTLVPGTLTIDCYPSDPQTFYEAMIAVTLAQLDEDFPGVVVGADEPPAEYQDRVWFRTTDLQWYYYVNGSWVRPHPTPASGNERRLWVGIEADLDSYDGGTPGVVGPATGPMWEVDHNFDGRFPLGPGTLPSGAAVNVTNTGGEERHTLLATENGVHTHIVNTNDRTDAATLWSHFDATGEVPSALTDKPIAPDATGTTTPLTALADATAGQPHNNMPPYYGVFIIQRTARTLILA